MTIVSLTSSQFITEVKYTCHWPEVRLVSILVHTGSNSAHHKYSAAPKNLFSCPDGILGLSPGAD